MSRDKGPVTPAVRFLREHGVEFTEHFYKYVEHGGTAEGARQLGLDEHLLVKTLVMEDELKRPMIVLMHGDLEVSVKELARVLGVKRVCPCAPETAQKHSGYMVGGTSPFGTRKEMPVYVEESVHALPRIYINGGKRGYLLGIEPAVLSRLLKAASVTVGIR